MPLARFLPALGDPDKGLLCVVTGRARKCSTRRFTRPPETPSKPFHARTSLAPVAADIEAGARSVAGIQESLVVEVDLGPQDLAKVVYVVHYGSVMSGLRAAGVLPTAIVGAGECRPCGARVFGGHSWGIRTCTLSA
ncbi:MAG: SAM-dependent chlorinase/fluorinase [Betaproteobacteria bacterium]|nr:SAM-dependent chlorinase/fluorinase [Betaproteobacteria bacterium]